MNLSLHLLFLPCPTPSHSPSPHHPPCPVITGYLETLDRPCLTHSHPRFLQTFQPTTIRVKLDPSRLLSLSLSLSVLRILKEAGQADNLAVLLLVGRSLAFYMLEATVRQPFSPLYAASSVHTRPSPAPRSPRRSLVFHPTAAARFHRHNGYDPPPYTGNRRAGFSCSNTSFDFYRVFSPLLALQVCILLLFQRLPPRCYGIQRTAIYEFDRKHDDYARPIGVFLCTKER